MSNLGCPANLLIVLEAVSITRPLILDETIFRNGHRKARVRLNAYDCDRNLGKASGGISFDKSRFQIFIHVNIDGIANSRGQDADQFSLIPSACTWLPASILPPHLLYRRWMADRTDTVPIRRFRREKSLPFSQSVWPASLLASFPSQVT